MVEIEKYRDLLVLLNQLSVPLPEVPETVASLDATDEDSEAEEWASLVVGANANLMSQARIRTCVSGLAAVSQYLAERDSGQAA